MQSSAHLQKLDGAPENMPSVADSAGPRLGARYATAKVRVNGRFMRRLSSRWRANRSVSENPVYKVVGIVKRHFRFRESGAESRALREAGVYRQTLDAADGSPPFRADEAELRPIQDSVSTLDQGSLL